VVPLEGKGRKSLSKNSAPSILFRKKKEKGGQRRPSEIKKKSASLFSHFQKKGKEEDLILKKKKEGNRGRATTARGQKSQYYSLYGPNEKKPLVNLKKEEKKNKADFPVRDFLVEDNSHKRGRKPEFELGKGKGRGGEDATSTGVEILDKVPGKKVQPEGKKRKGKRQEAPFHPAANLGFRNTLGGHGGEKRRPRARLPGKKKGRWGETAVLDSCERL